MVDHVIPSASPSVEPSEELDFEENDFTGTIPTELGNLTSLEDLWLNDNKLTGTIPTQLAQLMELEKIYLQGNMFINDPISGRAVPEQVCVALFPDTEPIVIKVFKLDNATGSVISICQQRRMRRSQICFVN